MRFRMPSEHSPDVCNRSCGMEAWNCVDLLPGSCRDAPPRKKEFLSFGHHVTANQVTSGHRYSTARERLRGALIGRPLAYARGTVSILRGSI